MTDLHRQLVAEYGDELDAIGLQDGRLLDRLAFQLGKHLSQA